MVAGWLPIPWVIFVFLGGLFLLSLEGRVALFTRLRLVPLVQEVDTGVVAGAVLHGTCFLFLAGPGVVFERTVAVASRLFGAKRSEE